MPVDAVGTRTSSVEINIKKGLNVDEVARIFQQVFVFFTNSLERPRECSCRKRTILVSYADENVRSFFFCLRVQEYDFRGGAVEAGNAAIEYMESVPGIVPKEYAASRWVLKETRKLEWRKDVSWKFAKHRKR